MLFSPCDDIGLVQDHYGEEEMRRKVNFALRFAQEHSFKDWLLPRFFFGLPISVATFLSYYGPSSSFDIFYYYAPLRPFKELADNQIPTLVVFGEEDYFLDREIIEKIYSQFANYVLKFIPGANHHYSCYERELAKVSGQFLAKI